MPEENAQTEPWIPDTGDTIFFLCQDDGVPDVLEARAIAVGAKYIYATFEDQHFFLPTPFVYPTLEGATRVMNDHHEKMREAQKRVREVTYQAPILTRDPKTPQRWRFVPYPD